MMLSTAPRAVQQTSRLWPVATLLFALVGPVALLANAVADRWGAGRTHRRATAEHAVARRVAQKRLDRALQYLIGDRLA